MPSLRTKTIRLAASLPKGSQERQALLQILAENKEPWKHWGKSEKDFRDIAEKEYKRLGARSKDDFLKKRLKSKPSMPSDGSSGQYDAWSHSLAFMLDD